mgnify:FL=1
MNKIFFYTPANIINNSFYTLIMVAFAFFGEAKISAEIALFISIIFLFTQIFSANMRNIIFTEFDKKLLSNVKIFRIIFLIPILIISNFVFFFITNIYSQIIICLSFLIAFSWINEMNILSEELNKKKIKTILFLAFNIIFTLLVLCFIFLKNKPLIVNVFYIQILFNFLIFYKTDDYSISKLKLFFGSRSFRNIQKYNYAFLSSSSMIVANFISRFTIFYSIDKTLAGIIFSAYAIGSFPGTIFNNTFGPTLIKNKIKLNRSVSYILTIILFILLISAIMFFFKTNDVMFNNDVLIFTTLISLIGSYLMVYSLYTRQLILNKNVIFHNLVFKYDIFLNFLLILLTFIICLVDINFIYFLFFFIFSMISLIVYKTMKFNIQNV